MNLKNTLFILVLIISIIKAKGQNYQKDVIPPDPVSAQFQKYLGYPVSIATGIPEINIPLYTMEVSGVSIPFSLSYHASGIRVDEVPGPIGLGWSLFPGFKITRTIMGKPDNLAPTNDIRNVNNPSLFPLMPNTIFAGKPFMHDSRFNYLFSITPHEVGNTEISPQTEKDGQYDIFSVHLPTSNANFILEWKNGKLEATTIPEQPISIKIIENTAGTGDFVSFEITDEQGIVYIFSGESQYIEYQNDVTVSWFLKEINPPGVNNSIHFKYDYSSVNMPEYVTTAFTRVIDQHYGLSSSSVGTYLEIYGDSYETGTVSVPYNTRSINAIDYDSGESVLFEYDGTMYSEEYQKLTKIVFKNSIGNLIKSISFSRLNDQLSGLVSSGDGSYTFSYDNQVIADKRSQDHLGLYNAKSNNYLSPKILMSFDTHSGSGPYEVFLGTADRSFDPVASQARILKNIIYPTGGQTSFEFEPNGYESSQGIKCGFGLRVKQINTYDPVSQKTMIKSYKYGTNENGIGHLTKPYYNTSSLIADYISTLWKYGDGSYRIQDVLTQPKLNSTEPIIWYDEVAEYANSDNGKTVYNYEYTPSTYAALPVVKGPSALESDPSFSYPDYFPVNLRNIGTGGPRIIKKQTFNQNANIDQLTEYQYNYDSRSLMGVYAKQGISFENGNLLANPICVNTECPQFVEIGASGDQYLVADNYWLEIDNTKLSSTKQTDYLNGQAITTTTNFAYDDTYKYNLKSKSVSTSTGDVLTEKYYYPVGDAIPDLVTMTSTQQAMVGTLAFNNYRTTIIEKETLRNNVGMSKELFGYKNWGNSILKPEQIYAKKGVNNFDSRYFYHGYDDKGNVLEVSKANDSHTFYVWGYNKQYPVAKLENFESSQIIPAIQTAIDAVVNASNADNDRTIGIIGMEGALRSALAALRDTLPNTIVTAFTYDPLVGVTSTTDPKGNTNYYDYDSNNKLKETKDRVGNYLAEYKYNYVPLGTYNPIAAPAYSGNLYCGGGQTFSTTEGLMYAVDTQNLVFENTPVGWSSERSFNITNTSPTTYSSPVNIGSILLPHGFNLVSASELPFTLLKGESKNIRVSFDPDAVTTFSGGAIISSNAAVDPQINLSGTGLPGSTDSRIIDFRYNGTSINSLDFGTISGSETTSKTIQIYNTGNSNLDLNNYAFGSWFWSYYYISNAPSLPITIAPGGHVDIGIDFMDGNAGQANPTSTITINSNKTSGNNVLNLTGTIN